jgi:Protein of unknown function (DUF2652)/Polyketide cyclase / dehydrase and lipid transport
MLSVGEPTCFLIADISGYTTYLGGVELDHAQDIVGDLVSTIVTALRPTFRLAKLEGDAAFMYAPAEKVDGSILLDSIERCYFGFRRRRRDVRQATSCECDACARIPDLNLKFVAHNGLVRHQKMAGLDELIGTDVIVVHRMLKNHVVEQLRLPAYALLTQACVAANGIDPDALGMVASTENYEGVGDVTSQVLDLERRWQDEDARARVRVTAADALFTASIPSVVPPQVLWDFVTEPGRRMGWQVGTTEIIVDSKGGRRGVGTTNHCMHGQDALIEEILDWRPYDYLTERITMGTPGGPVKFVASVEFEPTPDGTTVHFRFGAPKGAKELAKLESIGPAMDAMFRARGVALTAQLAAELGAVATQDFEPELPAARPDGALALLVEVNPAG